MLRYLTSIVIIAGAVFSPAHASSFQNFTLHLQAEPGTENHLANICMSTNNGFTKSCGERSQLDDALEITPYAS